MNITRRRKRKVPLQITTTITIMLIIMLIFFLGPLFFLNTTSRDFVTFRLPTHLTFGLKKNDKKNKKKEKRVAKILRLMVVLIRGI